MSDMNTYAVIVAGGSGSRMGSPVPKQFMHLLGRPLLCYAIDAFLQAIPGIKLILVLPASEMSSAQVVCKSYHNNLTATYVSGGETRYQSVQNGLKEIGENGIVFVHDGARPLVSVALIERCYRQALEVGSAIPVIPVTDSIRMAEGDTSTPLNRDNMRIVQTPQAFRTEVLLPAFTQDYIPGFTDEATVVEAHGTPVHIISGEKINLKVTTPEDMIIAEALLKARNDATV